MRYSIPKDTAQAEIEVKKSRFIALAAHANSRQSAMQFLEQIQQAYPDARHHCWAYVLGNPACASSAGMGDDGEPSGTAGRPILNVLQHKNVGDIVLVVARYFGGIKLGAGGLTRAYSQAAQAVMERLVLSVFEERIEVECRCAFADEAQVRHFLTQFDAQILQVDYFEQVRIRFTLVKERLKELTTALASRIVFEPQNLA